MKKKNKSLLSVISLACLALVAGTFAWTSFNQRALNEDNGVKDNSLAEGRVHDDYSKATGNKDVYAENYGKEDLVVRIRLSEYFEDDGTPLVAGTVKNDFKTWTPYVLPEQAGNYRDYVSWTLGGEKIFLPTFNTNNQSESVDVTGDGIDRDTGNTGTAPGTGEHNAFTAGQGVVNPNDPLTSHTAKHTLAQKNAPITMAAWKALPAADKIGNFWVIDTDGWAYWANTLKPTESTSLLLDKIDINARKVGKLENWYYGIDVHGQFATLDETNDFDNNGNITNDGKDLIGQVVENTFTYQLNFTSSVSNVEMTAGTTQTFGAKLEKISSLGANSIVPTTFTWTVTGGSAGTTISNTGQLKVAVADANKTLTVKVVSTVKGLDSSFPVKVNSIVAGVNPGGEFKFNDEDYLYLKDLGNGNHLILRKFLLSDYKATSLTYHGSELDKAMTTYYNGLSVESKVVVQPVQTTFTLGSGGKLSTDGLTIDNTPNDFVTVTPTGTKKAFALSAKEVSDVSGPGKAFPTIASRLAAKEATPASPNYWWLRTPNSASYVWLVTSRGQFNNYGPTNAYGIRPALVIHQ